MFKKSSFGNVFGTMLAVIFTTVSVIYVQATQHTLTIGNLIPDIITGSAIGFYITTVIDIVKFGDFFVEKFHLKKDGKAAYCVQMFFIALLVVVLMDCITCFVKLFFTVGPMAFLMAFLTSVIPITVLVYVILLLIFPMMMKITKSLCTKEG